MRIFLLCLLAVAVCGTLMLAVPKERTASPMATYGPREPRFPNELSAVNDPLIAPIPLQTASAPPLALLQFPPESSHTPRDLLDVGERSQPPLDFSSGERAHFHPHGDQVCASGCAVSNHPTPELSRKEFLRLLAGCVLGPLDETNRDLETLLYYGRQARTHLEQIGQSPLDESRMAFLRRELSRTHASVSFRLIDESGKILAELPPTRVPLDRRHVFELEATDLPRCRSRPPDGTLNRNRLPTLAEVPPSRRDLPPLVASGTVKRVGLHHLWTRI